MIAIGIVFFNRSVDAPNWQRLHGSSENTLTVLSDSLRSPHPCSSDRNTLRNARRKSFLSGIPDQLIKKSITCGICKLNINTDLQIVWAKDVREFLNENHTVYDPRKIIKSGEQAMKEKIKEKIYLLNSNGKA